LPSITPGYLYTFIALIAVSSLLVFSFMTYADALRVSSEAKQLRNLMEYVTAKSTELIALALDTNATAETYLQMPATLGYKQYWLQLRNDSAKTWLEGGFGDTTTEGTELRVYLPEEASASGYYMGGHGAACLKCYLEAGVPRIQLENSS